MQKRVGPSRRASAFLSTLGTTGSILRVLHALGIFVSHLKFTGIGNSLVSSQGFIYAISFTALETASPTSLVKEVPPRS